MRNFLEELYFGNLDPQARGYRKESHILKVSENINELEEKLTQRLNDEEKKMFLDFCWIFLCGSTAVPEERIPPIQRQETAVPEQRYRT